MVDSDYIVRDNSSVASTKLKLNQTQQTSIRIFGLGHYSLFGLLHSFKGTMEAVAKHDFNANEVDELSFRKSQILKVSLNIVPILTILLSMHCVV